MWPFHNEWWHTGLILILPFLLSRALTGWSRWLSPDKQDEAEVSVERGKGNYCLNLHEDTGAVTLMAWFMMQFLLPSFCRTQTLLHFKFSKSIRVTLLRMFSWLWLGGRRIFTDSLSGSVWVLTLKLYPPLVCWICPFFFNWCHYASLIWH